MTKIICNKCIYKVDGELCEPTLLIDPKDFSIVACLKFKDSSEFRIKSKEDSG